MGGDYLTHEDGIASLAACQQLCSAKNSACQLVAYNSASFGEKRCGLYKSKCQGQQDTACGNAECYRTYQKVQTVESEEPAMLSAAATTSIGFWISTSVLIGTVLSLSSQ